MAFQRSTVRLDADGLYAKGVAALARRSRSAAEIRKLLLPRAVGDADLEDALARLRDHGYLDDRRFAESYARFQLDTEKHGRQRVTRDLRARGVSDAVVAPAVRTAYAGHDDERLIRAFIAKKRLKRPENIRLAASLYRRLILAGFSPSAVQQSLRRWKVDPEWVELLADAEMEER
ncbi:MAG: regulatory protein RecX [Terriglobales bacterium]